MLGVWMFVAFCEVTKQSVVQGYYTNPFIENTDDLPGCGKECIASKLDVAVPLACRVPGRSNTSNVAFQIGKHVRLQALRVGETDSFRATGYLVQDADHLTVLSCDVTQQDGTGSAHATATLYVAKDSTKPHIELDMESNKLTCTTKGGRPPPALAFNILELPNRTRATQVDREVIVTSLTELVEGMIVTCCTKSRFFDSKCAPPFAIKYKASSTSVPSTTRNSADTESESTFFAWNTSATIEEFTETTPLSKVTRETTPLSTVTRDTILLSTVARETTPLPMVTRETTPLSTVTRASPPTDKSSHEHSYSIMKVVTIAVSSVLCFLIVVMIIAGFLRLRKRARKRLNSVQNVELVSSYHTLSGPSLGVSNYDVVQKTFPQRESVHYSEPTI